MSAAVIGFVIIIVASASIVEASDINQDLIDAASDGQLEKVKILIDEGVDVNAKENSGQTALIKTSRDGRLDYSAAQLE